jgi:glycosyltransferase involved in cell wall biosynthesis
VTTRRVLWVSGMPILGGGESAQIAIFSGMPATTEVSAVIPTEAWPSFKSRLRDVGIRHWDVPLKRFERTLNPARLAKTTSEFISRTRFLVRLVRSEKVDVIHVGFLFDLPYCAAAATICRVPLVWLLENPERWDSINRTVVRSCRPDAIVGTSSAVLNEALAAGVSARTTAVVGNAYDDQVFNPSGRTHSREDRFVVGFVGVFCERKGVIELCRAYGQLSKRARARGLLRTELHLVGGGPPEYVQEMKRALSEAGVLDETRFLGHRQTPAEVHEFYESIDLLVMLSKKEGMSVAMLEAMGSGTLTAILSPWGDDVVVDGRTGIRLPSDSSEQVADALWPIVSDPRACARLAQEGAVHVRNNFARAAVAEKLGQVYDRVLQRYRSKAPQSHSRPGPKNHGPSAGATDTMGFQGRA